MYTEKDINNMKCFVFRIAQRTWGKSSKELSKIFDENKLFECIDNNYDYMHLMSYDALFDYDGTGLWKESPLYLLSFYEECQNS